VFLFKPQYSPDGKRFAVLATEHPSKTGDSTAGETSNVGDFDALAPDVRRIAVLGVSAAGAVKKMAPVDDKRLAIYGHSYGGFMTAWATTQTDRFKAAAASTTIPNWVSDYGVEQIPKWILPYFNGITPYDRPDIFDRISPERFVKQVKTPTFIYNGELDVEAPAIQSFEWYSALKTVGVPASLVIYPANTRDATARTVAWFDKYVGAGAR
jgi:dipeptidyl aminopeptidase/acylaminoacyl peptidase